MRYVGSLLYDAGTFLWLGGAGLILGISAGFLLCRTTLRRAIMVLLGFVGLTVTEGYFIWWGTRPCGEGCVRDATLGLVSGLFNFFTYFAGAAIGLTVAARLGRIEEPAALRRNTRTAILVAAFALVLITIVVTLGWFLGLLVFVVVVSIRAARRHRARPGRST